MGFTVFFLVVLPVMALAYLPVTTRTSSLNQSQSDGDSIEFADLRPAAAKGIDSMRWQRSAEEHFRTLKSAA